MFYLSKQAITSLLFAALATMAQAQTVYKVDISEFNRNNLEEILEPSFTLWQPKQKDFNEMTLSMDDGVTFTVRSEHNMRSGWNKVFVQSKVFNSRLTGDGLNLDPNECGSFQLVIKGLAPGTHTIQTYHNSWGNPATTVAWPITLSLAGEVVGHIAERTLQQASMQDASVLVTTFNVASADEEIIFTVSTSNDDAPADMAGKTGMDKTPVLNGFMIDAIQSSAQAKRPNPADLDMHVDADDGTYRITWAPASDHVVKHRFFFGTDSATVADAVTPTYEGTDTAFVATGLRNLDTYYWHVDEVTTSQGGETVTKGEVWQFRPRHLAFPGAEGYGRFANGGRGGVVYHVTNLSDDGQPGSFRYGMETLKGRRTIVFDVSGIIPLRTTLRAGDANATIAGQTAPGKGICFRGAAMGFGSDQVVRFIRNRVGSGPTADGMGFRSAREAIMDHCSISWSIDEGFSSREAGNITFQRTLISESLNMANHDKYDENSRHGFAAVYGGDIGSFHHNLLANNTGRNPRLDGGMDGNGYYMGRLDIFNNVVYNWNSHPAYGEAHEANFHRNFYKMGPATTRKWILIADVNQRGSNKGTESYYYMYNVLVDKTGKTIFDGTKHGNGTSTNVDGGKWQLVNPMPVDWNPWVDEPFFPSYATVETANEAYKTVLSNVGCNQPIFDDHDQRQVYETMTGTNKYVGSRSGLAGLPDTEEDVGGFELYPEDTRAANYDTDQDGMPDWWEQLTGSDKAAADNNADPDQDGYTLLEDYLNFMAEEHRVMQPGSQATIDVAKLFAGFTKSPQFTAEETGTETGTGTGTKAKPILHSSLFTLHLADGLLTVKAGSAEGLSAIKLTVTDSEGTTYSRMLNIAVSGEGSMTAVPTITADDIVSYELFDLNGRRLPMSVLPGKADSSLFNSPSKTIGGKGALNSHSSLIKGAVYLMRATDRQGRQHTIKAIKH